LGSPRYVSRIDPLTNTITLGRRQDLETTTIELERATFVAGHAPAGGSFRADVRIRHRAEPIPATVRPGSGRGRAVRWTIETDVPVWAAAPGQAAVLYAGEVVLGGGRIARTAAAAPAAAAADAVKSGELVASGR
jgi:tRNA-specific 2-thiouridylase